MNERDREAALEAFKKDYGLPDSTTVTQVEAAFHESWPIWLRACEWMYEYATQETYKRCEQICRNKANHAEENDDYGQRDGAIDCADYIKEEATRSIANESSGK